MKTVKVEMEVVFSTGKTDEGIKTIGDNITNKIDEKEYNKVQKFMTYLSESCETFGEMAVEIQKWLTSEEVTPAWKFLVIAQMAHFAVIYSKEQSIKRRILEALTNDISNDTTHSGNDKEVVH